MNDITQFAAPALLQPLDANVAKPVRAPLQRTPHRLALEQRFMFDGAAAHDASHAAQAAHDPGNAAALAKIADVPPAVQVRAADPEKTDQKKEVVIVDTSVANYKTLEASIRDGVGIVEIDGSKDGLAQMAKWAESQSGYDSISILSHGANGQLRLGSTTLTDSSLSDVQVQAELAEIGHALNAGGDVLLYGCDIAADQSGIDFINDFSHATGADVAASSNLTGAAARGGDWTLERSTGALQAQDLQDLQARQFDTQQLSRYTDVLDPGPTLNITLDRSAVNLSDPGVNVTFTFSESVFGFDISDINVGPNARVSSLTTSDNITWTARVDITATGEASGNVVQVNMAAVQDISATAGVGVATSLAYSFDTAPPTVVITIDHSTMKRGDTAIVTFTFSEPVTGVTFFDITAPVGSGLGFLHTTDNITWTATFFPSNGLVSANNVITVDGGSWIDSAGNFGTGRTFSPNIVIDTVAPDQPGPPVLASANDTGAAGDGITADNVVTLSGSAENGSSVGIYDGATLLSTVTAGASGWSYTTGVLADGTHAITVVATDAVGNASVASGALNLIIDTVGITPGIPVLAPGSDTGASNSDGITSTTTPILTGTAEAGDVVRAYDTDGTVIGATTADINGNWSITTSALAESDHTITVRTTDLAGNVSAPSNALSITIDTTIDTPGTPAIYSGSDTGPSNSDGITSNTTPVLSGTAAAGDIVKVYDTDTTTALGTATADGSGHWSIIASTLAEGDHTITARATDIAGNISTFSSALNVRIDTTAPFVTSLSVPSNNTYFGGDPLDFTVNFNETVTVDSSGGTPVIALTVGSSTRFATYVSGSGTSALTFRYVVPNGDLDANGIAIGALLLSGGSIRDAAGNAAAVTLNSVGSTAGVDVDGIAPSITNVDANTPDGDYGPNQTITITVDFSSAVTVDTTNGTPTLTLDGGGSATYTGGSGTNALTFTYIVGAGQNSADLDYSSTNALTLNGATIVETGSARQSAVLTLATPGTAGSLGANKDIVIDTSAPTNTAASVVFSNDTAPDGMANNDLITSVAAQTINGTLSSNLAAGETVQVSLDNGVHWMNASASVGDNGWSLAGLTLTGSNTLQVRVIDAAGNIGSVFSAAYVLDTTAPTVSFTGIALSNDTGVPGDLITNSVAQTITATLGAALNTGDTVYGSLDGGASWIDITAKVSGTTLTWDGVTLATSGTLQLWVDDAAGNESAHTSRAYVLDTTAPVTGVASVGFSNDSGPDGVNNNDFITDIAAQTISGTLTANLATGETVQVSLDNGGTWQTASSTVGFNTWTLAGVTLTASDTLLVKVSDIAGNDGSILAQAYVFDTAAPAVGFNNLTLSNDSGSSNSDFITNAAAQTITATINGTLGAGDTVMGSLDNGVHWVDITSKISGGALTWDGVSLAGSNTILIKVADLAGNERIAVNQAYTLDTSAPAVAIGAVGISTESGNGNGGATETISVTLDNAPAATDIVLGSLDGGATWTDISGKISGNTLTWSGLILTAGGNTLLLKVQDNAGNNEALQSQAFTYTPPPPPPVTPVTPVTPATPAAPVEQLPTNPPPVTAFDMLDAPSPVTMPVGLFPPDLPQIPATVFLSADSPLNDMPVWDLSNIPAAIVQTARLNPDTGPGSRNSSMPDRPQANTALPLNDLTVNAGEPFSFQVPADTFHAGGDGVTLFATTVDGRALPAWLIFAAKTGTFTGRVPPGMGGEMNIRITARDQQGHETVRILKIKVGEEKPNHASIRPDVRPQAQALSGARIASDQPAIAAGRSSLSAQLHASRHGGADRLAALAHSAVAALAAMTGSA